MSVNLMNFEQAASVLNSLQEQATGKKGITPTNTADFVSVANTTLQAGYEPVLNAITQMVSKTIFSTRPYTGKMRMLDVGPQKYGAITRKLNIVDKPFEEDDSFNLVDGNAIDQYKVNKPQIVQTNYYGMESYQKSYTIFKDQLDSAFTGPEQFAEFMAMVASNCNDMIEQSREDFARMTLCNYIGGHKAAGMTVSLIGKYNDHTGAGIDSTTVYQKENFSDFCMWLYSFMATNSQMMSERSINFHLNIKDTPISRHTPIAMQKTFIRAPFLNEMNARVVANTYHKDFLQYSNVESVNYWQSINNPEGISIKPSYLDTETGAVKTSEENVVINEVVAVTHDPEAVAIATVNPRSFVTPFNARGEYWNMFHKFTMKSLNDFTENGIVYTL